MGPPAAHRYPIHHNFPQGNMGQCITPALHTFSLLHTSKTWKNPVLRLEEDISEEECNIMHFQMRCILSIALWRHISHLRICLNLSKLYIKCLNLSILASISSDLRLYYTRNLPLYSVMHQNYESLELIFQFQHGKGQSRQLRKWF